MRNHLKYFCIFIFSAQAFFAQNKPVELKNKIPLKIDRFEGIDKYGNIYYFKNNVFYKFGKDGNFHFSDLQLGKPTSSDLINPLKIVLFYEAMNTLVLVDHHLIEIARINFNRLETIKTLGHASEASGDKIWLFNIDNQQLEIFDYIQQKTVASSQPLASKVLDIVSNFNFCWILTENLLTKYNTYGSLLEKTTNIGFEELAEDNGNLVAKKDNTLFIRLKNSMEFEELLLPVTNVKDFYLNDKKLYIYDGEFLNEFHLN